MGNSNFKKLVSICEYPFSDKLLVWSNPFQVDTIITKYRCTVSEKDLSSCYFVEINSAAPVAERDLWKADIEDAEVGHQEDVKSMDVILLKFSKGASLKEIEAMIAMRDSIEDEPLVADNSGATSWLVSGLCIQDNQ